MTWKWKGKLIKCSPWKTTEIHTISEGSLEYTKKKNNNKWTAEFGTNMKDRYAGWYAGTIYSVNLHKNSSYISIIPICAFHTNDMFFWSNLSLSIDFGVKSYSIQKVFVLTSTSSIS